MFKISCEKGCQTPVQDDRYEKPFYTTRNIFVKNIEKIVDRNEKKRNNINKISSMPIVLKDIPYEAYYMSSNFRSCVA